MQDLILLKLTHKVEENGEVTIQLVTPLSTAEVTATAEIAEQIYSQLGKRFLETVEEELTYLEEEMHAKETVHYML